jgi:hypothetical protein
MEEVGLSKQGQLEPSGERDGILVAVDAVGRVAGQRLLMWQEGAREVRCINVF